MSILGLIYGLSSLLITVSFYGRNILVEETLCNGLAVVQSHVASAYVVNICSIAVEVNCKAWGFYKTFDTLNEKHDLGLDYHKSCQF